MGGDDTGARGVLVRLVAGFGLSAVDSVVHGLSLRAARKVVALAGL